VVILVVVVVVVLCVSFDPRVAVVVVVVVVVVYVVTIGQRVGLPRIDTNCCCCKVDETDSHRGTCFVLLVLQTVYLVVVVVVVATLFWICGGAFGVWLCVGREWNRCVFFSSGVVFGECVLTSWLMSWSCVGFGPSVCYYDYFCDDRQ